MPYGRPKMELDFSYGGYGELRRWHETGVELNDVPVTQGLRTHDCNKAIAQINRALDKLNKTIHE